ncbi:MAG: hypothetical protein HND39_01775 [Ignavibacteriota bacterium]|nr:hypothetical protein [Ignavibacteriaceae bacterium]MEB2297672.1 hypothetical protein [Ignavibacteria bacterium]NUM61296.1 hypothetical protein [Ignavibacteriaceae bacterium]QKJ95092.1 MAG: hypothetical protein HND39_01775 [Ignavibacteriota bacterium]
MNSELEKIIKEIPGYNISMPLNKIPLEIFNLKTQSAKLDALAAFVIEYIAEKGYKEEEEVRADFEELYARILADEIAQFLSDYGR